MASLAKQCGIHLAAPGAVAPGKLAEGVGGGSGEGGSLFFAVHFEFSSGLFALAFGRMEVIGVDPGLHLISVACKEAATGLWRVRLFGANRQKFTVLSKMAN